MSAYSEGESSTGGHWYTEDKGQSYFFLQEDICDVTSIDGSHVLRQRSNSGCNSSSKVCQQACIVKRSCGNVNAAAPRLYSNGISNISAGNGSVSNANGSAWNTISGNSGGASDGGSGDSASCSGCNGGSAEDSSDRNTNASVCAVSTVVGVTRGSTAHVAGGADHLHQE